MNFSQQEVDLAFKQLGTYTFAQLTNFLLIVQIVLLDPKRTDWNLKKYVFDMVCWFDAGSNNSRIDWLLWSIFSLLT